LFLSFADLQLKHSTKGGKILRTQDEAACPVGVITDPKTRGQSVVSSPEKCLFSGTSRAKPLNNLRQDRDNIKGQIDRKNSPDFLERAYGLSIRPYFFTNLQKKESGTSRLYERNQFHLSSFLTW
jgi:hypothetical protein